MTVSTRTSAPSYKIFEPDALDAIYAKGNLDPIMGGISYAFGSAHKMDKAGYQDQYLASQERFNKMAAGLDALEMSSKQKTELLKGAIDLIGKGESPAKLFGGNEVYRNDQDALLPGLMAQKAAGSGGSGGTKETETHELTGATEDGTYKISRKGPPGTVSGVVPPKDVKPGSTPISGAANSDASKAQAIVKTATQLLGPDVGFVKKPDGSVIARSASQPGRELQFDQNGVLKR